MGSRKHRKTPQLWPSVDQIWCDLRAVFSEKAKRTDHTRFCLSILPKFTGQNLVSSARLSFLKKQGVQITPDFVHVCFPNSLAKIWCDLRGCLF